MWLVAALMVGGLIGWAVSVFASPPKQVAGEASYVLVTASSGQVSAKVASVVTATWPVHQVAVNQASGTLTRLAVGRGDEVHAGDVLYRVDERPVVVLEGSVPAFRALSVGVEGADVKQLTRFLVAKHYLASATSKYTGPGCCSSRCCADRRNQTRKTPEHGTPPGAHQKARTRQIGTRQSDSMSTPNFGAALLIRSRICSASALEYLSALPALLM